MSAVVACCRRMHSDVADVTTLANDRTIPPRTFPGDLSATDTLDSTDMLFCKKTIHFYQQLYINNFLRTVQQGYCKSQCWPRYSSFFPCSTIFAYCHLLPENMKMTQRPLLTTIRSIAQTHDAIYTRNNLLAFPRQ